MDGTWSPITSMTGVQPADRAIRQSENQTEKRQRQQMFRQAMQRRSTKEEEAEKDQKEASADQTESGSTMDLGARRDDLEAEAHQINFLA